MDLARLKIPTGWLVECNVLVEPENNAELQAIDDLREDLLLLKNKNRGVIVDLSWRPSFDPDGQFYLVAISLEDEEDLQIDAWDSPPRSKQSQSYKEIRAILEGWLEDISLVTIDHVTRRKLPQFRKD